MRMRTALAATGMAIVVMLAGCGGSEEEGRKPFKVGVASVKITPKKKGLYLGGWGENRAFTKVHDDIYARAIVFQRGDTTAVWVSLDLVGLLGPDVDDIKSRVEGVPAGNIVICSTHVHSAPDTIGLWGPDEKTPGVDPEYVEFVKSRTASAIKQALRNARVARVKLVSAKAPPRCAKNHRDEKLIDPEMTILEAVDPAGEPIAVVVNWACHPECLDKHNLELTSDYVHWLRRVVEGQVGGTCLFFNGALGGMVSPDISEHSFKEAERVGTTVGKAVVAALEDAEGPLRPQLAFRSQRIRLRVEGQRLYEAVKAGLIVPYRGLSRRWVEADVAVMWLGPSVWMTMPGEPLPTVGLRAKSLANADYKFLVSLANNELGYILPKEFWGMELYDYEMSMSLGPETADTCLQALKTLLAEAPEWAGGRKGAGAEEAQAAPKATGSGGKGGKGTSAATKAGAGSQGTPTGAKPDTS